MDVGVVGAELSTASLRLLEAAAGCLEFRGRLGWTYAAVLLPQAWVALAWAPKQPLSLVDVHTNLFLAACRREVCRGSLHLLQRSTVGAVGAGVWEKSVPLDSHSAAVLHCGTH